MEWMSEFKIAKMCNGFFLFEPKKKSNPSLSGIHDNSFLRKTGIFLNQKF